MINSVHTSKHKMSMIIDSILFKCYYKIKTIVEDNGKCEAVLTTYDYSIFTCKTTDDILLC